MVFAVALRCCCPSIAAQYPAFSPSTSSAGGGPSIRITGRSVLVLFERPCSILHPPRRHRPFSMVRAACFPPSLTRDAVPALGNGHGRARSGGIDKDHSHAVLGDALWLASVTPPGTRAMAARRVVGCSRAATSALDYACTSPRLRAAAIPRAVALVGSAGWRRAFLSCARPCSLRLDGSWHLTRLLL